MIAGEGSFASIPDRYTKSHLGRDAPRKGLAGHKANELVQWMVQDASQTS